jgi:hypothetical protein
VNAHLHTPPTHARTPAVRSRRRGRTDEAAIRTALLLAARLGGDAARADLSGDEAAAATAFAASRQLRRRTDRQSRQMLRVAFDTGYGQAMTPVPTHQ